MEKPIEINGMSRQFICTAPHAKHPEKMMGKKLNIHDVYGVKAEKVILHKKLIMKRITTEKLGTLTLLDMILQKGQHKLKMINIESTTTKKLKNCKHAQKLYKKNEHCKKALKQALVTLESPTQ